MVSKGSIQVQNASAVTFRYNPAFLYDVVAQRTSAPTRLEQVSVSVY